VVFALWGAGLAGAQQAAPVIPRTPDGKPDLSGTWKTVSSKVSPIQMTAMGLDKFNYNKLPKGIGARTELDPIANCYRPGLARLGPPLLVGDESTVVRTDGEDLPPQGGMATLDAIMIRNTPQKVWMIYQYNQEVRQIFMDGRKHPEPDPDDVSTLWWNGYSTGTWDGDTLVVTTSNLRNETWLDNLGHENRELKIVERIRRVDAETLQIDRTLTDAMTLARPYTTSATLKAAPDLKFRENVVCGQYYIRKFAFGYDGLLGINIHPWQGQDRSTAAPVFTGIPDDKPKEQK
jgi:hypothetical protein